MASVGRNDPCPCGSRKKYKKCCLVEKVGDQAELRRAQLVHDLDHSVIERLTELEAPDLVERWMDDFLDEAGIEELDDLTLQLVLPCAMYDLPVGGLTMAARLLASPSARLAPRQRAWLEAQASTCLSVHEIVRVDPGRSLEVRDVLTGRERRVLERKGSSVLKVHDLVLGRVVEFEGLSLFIGLHSRWLEPRSGAELVAFLRRELGARTQPVSVERVRERLPLAELILHWDDAVADHDAARTQTPLLTNTDGDPMVHVRDRFRFTKAAGPEVHGLLAQLAEENEPEESPVPGAASPRVYTFSKAGNAMHKSWDNTIVGRAEVAATELVLETNSLRRADELRARVEEHLAGVVRHYQRDSEDQDAMMARIQRAPASGSQRQARPASPAELEAVREMKAGMYRDWLDAPRAALGDLTPRQAAKQGRSRKEVVVLLKEIENREATLPAGEAIDCAWMWHELGLSPSGKSGSPRASRRKKHAERASGAQQLALALPMPESATSAPSRSPSSTGRRPST